MLYYRLFSISENIVSALVLNQIYVYAMTMYVQCCLSGGVCFSVWVSLQEESPKHVLDDCTEWFWCSITKHVVRLLQTEELYLRNWLQWEHKKNPPELFKFLIFKIVNAHAHTQLAEGNLTQQQEKYSKST